MAPCRAERLSAWQRRSVFLVPLTAAPADGDWASALRGVPDLDLHGPDERDGARPPERGAPIWLLPSLLNVCRAARESVPRARRLALLRHGVHVVWELSIADYCIDDGHVNVHHMLRGVTRTCEDMGALHGGLAARAKDIVLRTRHERLQ